MLHHIFIPRERYHIHYSFHVFPPAEIEANDVRFWLTLSAMAYLSEPPSSFQLTCIECHGVQPVGRMVLNKNLDNFFNENEQLAFSPGVVPPGIYYTNDKMLQCRIFAYGDTQRHRLGPNYLLLPANAPKCAHHNNHHEGFMNFTHRDEEVICVLSDNLSLP